MPQAVVDVGASRILLEGQPDGLLLSCPVIVLLLLKTFQDRKHDRLRGLAIGLRLREFLFPLEESFAELVWRQDDRLILFLCRPLYS